MVPLQLRGHHFLCILTFVGEGYTPRFSANLREIIAAINAGRQLILTQGPDAVCSGLCASEYQTCGHNCTLSRIRILDAKAITSVEEILERDLNKPAPLSRLEVAVLRQAFQTNTIRSACVLCSWKKFCNGIAGNDFEHCLLTGS